MKRLVLGLGLLAPGRRPRRLSAVARRPPGRVAPAAPPRPATRIVVVAKDLKFSDRRSSGAGRQGVPDRPRQPGSAPHNVAI